LTSLVGDGEQPMLICDNARIHRCELIQELMESLNAFILYLPPYSPQLNPIELMFSKWKNEVKTRFKPLNSREVIQAVYEASKSITIQDCRGFIQRVETFKVKSMSSIPFNDN
jgi:transposase